MYFWIDIENSAGDKYGSGPITTATAWNYAPQLSRAGSFSFTMPLSDPKAALVQKRRIARCYALVNGIVTEQGAGVIESIRKAIDGQSMPMLTVSGGDLGRELTYRTMNYGAAGSYSYYSPVHIQYYDPPVTLTNAFDGDLDTYATVTAFASGQYIRFEFDDAPPAALMLYFSQGNAKTSSDTSWRYYNGSWTLLSNVVDNTISGGAKFAVSGRIEYDMPGDWIAGGGAVGSRYCIRVQSTSATFDAFRLDEAYGVEQGNTAIDLAVVMEKAQDPWDLDTTNWYATTELGSFDIDFAQETVLAALIKVAERTGEHFRIGPGRYVQWMRTDTPDSGIRALGPITSPIDAEGNDAVCLITNLEEIEDAQDEISRIYPYGGGSGDAARVTLADTTESAPSGYTMSLLENYIEKDGSDPEIYRTVVFSDIVYSGISEAAKRLASNAVFSAALTYLQARVTAPSFYRLTVGKLDGDLRPGDLFHLRYREVVDGIVIWDIEADLIATGLNKTISASGVHIVSIDAATVARPPESDEAYMSKQVEDLSSLIQHPQPIDNSLVFS